MLIKGNDSDSLSSILRNIQRKIAEISYFRCEKVQHFDKKHILTPGCTRG